MKSAHVLGQLLLMQNVMCNLPDQESILSFVCRGLGDVPGIAEVRCYEFRQHVEEPTVIRQPLLVGGSCLGELALYISDPVAFAPYAEYVENFCFMTAVILEERNQRRAIELHRLELEERVQVRTKELTDEIAERKRIEAERKKLIRTLEAQNTELERFAYAVSHDLKTPLLTVKWLLGTLREDLEDRGLKSASTHLARADAAADQMAQLLHDLLELARVGRVVNPAQQVPVTDLVREALELTAGPIRARGVHVEFQPGTENFFGDRCRLIEVVQNLIDNAVKYMGDQTNPCIEIRTTRRDDQLTCRIRDNGIGINPRYQDRVFKLFEQIDPNAEGSGVGLTLVKRIVEWHGGSIWVESDGEGCGTTFCFTIPDNAPPEHCERLTEPGRG